MVVRYVLTFFFHKNDSDFFLAGDEQEKKRKINKGITENRWFRKKWKQNDLTLLKIILLAPPTFASNMHWIAKELKQNILQSSVTYTDIHSI